MTTETMTPAGLISVQAMTARIACRWMSTRQLEGMSDSIDRAARLSAGSHWESKAAAHTEIFSLLGDATGYPALARLADVATGWVHDVTLTVGSAADDIILTSRRRLLRSLRLRDADGAGREMEHHLQGLHDMWRLAGPASRERPDLMIQAAAS